MSKGKIFLLVCLVLAAIVAGLILKALPSRNSIARAIRQMNTAQTKVTPPESRPSPVGAKALKGTDSPSGAPPQSTAKKAEHERKRLILLNLLDEDPSDIRICEQLGHTRFKPGQDNEELVIRELFESDRTDPVLEAYRAPLKAIFQSPELSSFLRELDTLAREKGESSLDDESFLEKIGFYGKAAKVTASLYSNKERFERLGDRAIHLGVLAQLAALKPELKDSSRVVDFCRRIETFNEDLNMQTLKQERAELLELMRESGVTPESLKFDPKIWTRLTIKPEKDRILFSLGAPDHE